jgi:hypothetical protein
MLNPCKRLRDRMSAYLDNALTPAERLHVEDHLHQCADCRAAVELMRVDAQDATASLLARGASDRFADRVMAIVSEEEIAPAPHEPAPVIELKPARRPVPWLRFGLAFGAVAVVAAVVLPLTLRPREKARMAASTGGGKQIVTAVTMYAQDAPEAPVCSEPIPVFGKYNARDEGAPATLRAADTNTVDNVDLAGGMRVILPTAPTPSIAPPSLNYGLAGKIEVSYTAVVAVELANVQEGTEAAERLFTRFEGFVMGSNFTRADERTATASVSGRVPSEKLGAFLIEADKLGLLKNRTVTGEDQTAKHMEQWEQLARLGKMVDNYDALRNRTKSDTAINAEEHRAQAANEVAGTKVEEYRLKSRVRLAEVTVALATPGATPTAPPTGASAAANRAWNGLRAFLTHLLEGVIIPAGIWSPVWAPLLGIALLGWRRKWWRKMGKG